MTLDGATDAVAGNGWARARTLAGLGLDRRGGEPGVRLVGFGLLVLGALTVWRLVRTAPPGRGERASGWARLNDSNPYRAGPWPGLSPAGGLLLLGCALLLAGGQLMLGEPRAAMPDLPLLGVLGLLPMALATRLVQAPGAASAVCGAYLLPRTAAGLLDPANELPVLLLLPALAFDLSAWLRATDFAALVRLAAGVMDRPASRWRRPAARPRRCGRLRAGLAGAMFGGVLVGVEPAFAVLLGADASAWSGPTVAEAAISTSLGCAVAGLLAARGADRT